jgi:hypothetical protein
MFIIVQFNRFVRVEDSFEMVHLVLKYVRKESGGTPHDAFAVLVIRAHGRFF